MSRAQDKLPSPEMVQMYKNAEDDVARRDYAGAITICKQALVLAPGNTGFRRLQGKALYLAGNFSDAEATFSTLVKEDSVDAESFRLLALSEVALHHLPQAESTLAAAISRFPSTGALYYEQGKIARLREHKDKAVKSWLTGMEKDPGYAPNYTAIANEDLPTDNLIWGLLYGETYLVMQHDTAGDDSMKRKLFAGWKTFFALLPEISTKKQTVFEKTFNGIFIKLTPVVSDGISTDNLVMVRTRFIMDWMSSYHKQLHVPLFEYHNKLLEEGKFEIYNEWLFGNAENEAQYHSWTEFHPGDIERFLEWRSKHPYLPAATVDDPRNTNLHRGDQR